MVAVSPTHLQVPQLEGAVRPRGDQQVRAGGRGAEGGSQHVRTVAVKPGKGNGG